MGVSCRVARNRHYESFAIGGTENHVHALLSLPGHVPVAEAAQKLKANSSRWLREDRAWTGWQEGYGAFSVSASNVDAVRHYIQNQPEHHRRRSFEDQFLTLLMKSGVAFNRPEDLLEVPSLTGLLVQWTRSPALTCWARIMTPCGLRKANVSSSFLVPSLRDSSCNRHVSQHSRAGLRLFRPAGSERLCGLWEKHIAGRPSERPAYL